MFRVMQHFCDFDHPLKVTFLYASETELHEKCAKVKMELRSFSGYAVKLPTTPSVPKVTGSNWVQLGAQMKNCSE